MKKFISFFTVLSLVLSSFFTINFNTAAANPPNDMPQDHTFYNYVLELIELGVIGGYPDGTFRPDVTLNRGQMAKFIVNAFDLEIKGDIEPFADMEPDHTFYNHILILKSHNIVNGFSDGTYRPEHVVTRGAAMKFIVNAARESKGIFNDTFTGDPLYTDVENHEQFAEFIHLASSYLLYDGTRIIHGYENGKFGAQDILTRGQIAKIISQTLKLINHGGLFNPPLENPHQDHEIEPDTHNEQNLIEFHDYQEPWECNEADYANKKTETGDIHVSTEGDDNNDGDPIRPLRTIHDALCRVQPGQTILIHPGVYDDSVIINDLGNATSPIIIRGMHDKQGKKPIIDGQTNKLFGISFVNSKNIIIENLDFTNFTDQGLHFEDSENIQIRNNRFYRNGFSSFGEELEREGYGLNIVNSFDVLIEGNHAYENGPNPDRVQDGVLGKGIHTYGNEEITIRDNKLNNNIGGGLLIENSTNVLITRNVIERNHLDAAGEYWDGGIWIDGSDNITLEENMLNNNHGPALEISDEDLQYPRTSLDIFVRNNTITNNRWGVFVWNYGICPIDKLSDDILKFEDNIFGENIDGDFKCETWY